MNKVIVFCVALITLTLAAPNSCPPGCSTCPSNVCSACNPGSYLSSNQCNPCLSNCTTCSNNSTCLSCISGSYLNTNNTCAVICLSYCGNSNTSCCNTCNSEYYQTGNQCAKCMANCLSCTDNTSCQKCASNYVYSASSGTCVSPNCDPKSCKICNNSATCTSCNDQYILNGSSCSQCPSSCLGCTNNTCACAPGNYSSSNTCLSCIANCFNCTNSSDCLYCSDGYILVYDNGVASCKTSTAALLVSLIIPIFLTVVVLVLLACCIRRLRNLLNSRAMAVADAADPANPADSIERIAPLSYEWKIYESRANWKDLQCPICLDGHPEIETNCRHMFHLKCMLTWSNTKKTCPACRQGLTEIKLVCFGCKGYYLSTTVEQAGQLSYHLCEQCVYLTNL